jgi:hypothetical protein
LPALERPPAVVAFSGGQDSSFVLAAALSAAKRHGLALPAAVTLRFPLSQAAQEDHWQEAVVRHLGVDEWQKIDLQEELDLLGPIAIEGLRAHGLRFPSNAHSMVPMARAARGGSLITGLAGDVLMRQWRWRYRTAFIEGSIPRRPRLLPHVLLGTAPAPIRRRVLSFTSTRKLMRGERGLSWLTEAGRSLVAHGLADWEDQPSRWAAFVDWASRRRLSRVGLETVQLLARDQGAEAHAPLLSPGVVDAIAAAGGRWGFGERGEALSKFAGGRLPDEVLRRRSKAAFHDAFWGPKAKAFAAQWDGEGTDHELVDSDALRKEWLSEVPRFHALLLLHHTWLHHHLGGTNS